jgi:hypothetical protein
MYLEEQMLRVRWCPFLRMGQKEKAEVDKTK